MSRLVLQPVDYYPKEKKLAENRAAVCNGCEFRKKNTTVIDFYYLNLIWDTLVCKFVLPNSF